MVLTASSEAVPSCYVIIFVLCGFRIQVDKDDSFHRLPSAWVNYLGNIQGQEVSLALERILKDKVHFGVLCFTMSIEISE